MKRMVLAAALALVACNQAAVEEPTLDRDRIAANRAVIQSCEAENWLPCDGGYMRLDGELLKIINVDEDAVVTSEQARYDEITSDQILERAPAGPVGDTYLNRVNGFVFRADDTGWRAAMYEHQLHRYRGSVAPAQPQGSTDQPKQ